jgi:hypothetical protein
MEGRPGGALGKERGGECVQIVSVFACVFLRPGGALLRVSLLVSLRVRVSTITDW